MSMIIDDIIEFDQRQFTQLKQISSSYTQLELHSMDKGFDLAYLSNDQKKDIINKKREIVNLGNQSPQTIDEEKLIFLSKHALQRCFERVKQSVGNMDIYVIEKLIQSDRVLKGQYKGYPQMSYTLQTENETEKFNTSISFVIHSDNERNIYVITVSRTEFSTPTILGTTRFTQTLEDDPRFEEILKRFSKD